MTDITGYHVQYRDGSVSDEDWNSMMPNPMAMKAMINRLYVWTRILYSGGNDQFGGDWSVLGAGIWYTSSSP